jgi:hypothetical protein
VDEVVGKHEFITYAAGLNADGSVKQIEIMDYRETGCSSAMVCHPGRFTRHATPATGLDSVEAFAEIFPVRCAGPAFFERGRVGILGSLSVAWRF